MIILETSWFSLSEGLILATWSESLLKYFEVSQKVYFLNDDEMEILLSIGNFTDDDSNYKEIVYPEASFGFVKYDEKTLSKHKEQLLEYLSNATKKNTFYKKLKKQKNQLLNSKLI